MRGIKDKENFWSQNLKRRTSMKLEKYQNGYEIGWIGVDWIHLRAVIAQSV
jgi:hypothetical protein